MKIVRVHNPSGLRANPRRKAKTMATKRRKRRRNSAGVGRPRRVAHKTVNPRRRRRRSRRNPTTIVARSRSTRRVINPRRRRRVGRRRNPSGIRIGQIIKDAIYGGGGAILTRAGAQLVEGFVPSQFATSPLARPITQGILAVTGVRWLGKKFLGQRQGDLMMTGGLVAAALSAADYYLPNVQSQITNLFQPIVAPPVTTVAGFHGGYGDVEDVRQLPGSMAYAGLGDVEELSEVFGY